MIRVCKNIAIVLIKMILTQNEELDERGRLKYKNISIYTTATSVRWWPSADS